MDRNNPLAVYKVLDLAWFGISARPMIAIEDTFLARWAETQVIAAISEAELALVS